MWLARLKKAKNLRLPSVVLIIAIIVLSALTNSSADILADKSATLSTADISATSTYRIRFSIPSAITFGSLEIQICSNDPFPQRPCTFPAGIDMTGATLSAQSGATGFVIAPGSTANRIVLTRVPSAAPAGAVSYTLDNIVNPSSPGSYYIRMQTFDTSDASGTKSYEGGIAYAIVNPISIKATVPPYLVFCTGVTIQGLNCTNSTGDYIDFGELSFRNTASGSSQILAATNAQSGYNVTVDGTTMTSGTNEIAAIPSNDVSRPGTPQFGLNLTANSTPAGGSATSGPGVAIPVAGYTQSNLYQFVDGDTLITWPVPDNLRLYTVSYIVNVPKDQAPGVYVTTLTYIALGTF